MWACCEKAVAGTVTWERRTHQTVKFHGAHFGMSHTLISCSVSNYPWKEKLSPTSVYKKYQHQSDPECWLNGSDTNTS